MPTSSSRSRRVIAVVAGVVLLAAVVAVAAAMSGDEPASGLTIGWGGSEEHPACVYDPGTRTVDATITVDGHAPDEDTVAVTVTAYADENTSREVGAGRQDVPVDGPVHTSVVVHFEVTKAPHVDEDGVAACSLSPLAVTY